MPRDHQAVQTVDRCVGKLVGAIVGGALVITADRVAIVKTRLKTTRTLNPVPSVLSFLAAGSRLKDRHGFVTVLKVLNLPVRGRMSGKPLFQDSCRASMAPFCA